MAIPFTKSSSAKRQEQVRANLGTEHFKKRRWFHECARFLAKHYLSITITVMTVALVYTHIYYYNKLTVMDQQIGNMGADVEAGIQMRQNIVNSLADVVDRFIDHEGNIFTSAMEARKDSMGVSNDLKKLIQTAKEFSAGEFSSTGLSKLMAVAENYPQLVSSQSYKALVDKIGNTETQIYENRVQFNSAVNVYNTCLSTFPGNIIGKVLRFQEDPYYTRDNGPEWTFGEKIQSNKITNKKE